MKTFKIQLLFVLLFIIPISALQAQDDDSQAYWVHEDVVKPSMVGEYENIVKELVENLKKHEIQEVNMIVANMDDQRYLYVGPIANMAQLDNPYFSTLAEKMGADKMEALFDKMDKCYDIEQNYVIHLDNNLSYMPSGITQTPEGQDYRKFHYYHYTPGNRAIVKEKLLAIKNLFASKGSKLNYRLYRSGFGTRGEFYMVAIAAKDALDYASKIAENNELMGEDWRNAYNDFMGSLGKYESFGGGMRPDMAYIPEE